MGHRSRLVIFLSTLILVVLLQLVYPITAFAQDEPTPTPTAPFEIPTENPSLQSSGEPLEGSIPELTVESLPSPDDALPQPAVDGMVPDSDISLIDLTQVLADTADIISTGDPSGTLQAATCGAPANATFRYYPADALHPNGTCSYAGGILTGYYTSPIQQAVTDARTGTNVTVEAGTYNENVTISRSISGLVGANLATTRIIGTVVIQNLTTSFTINNFTITGGLSASNDSGVTLTLTNLSITNAGGNGISVTNSSGTLALTNVTSSGNAGSGLVTNNSSGAVTLSGITMNNNGGDGASVDNSSGTTNVTLTGTNNLNGNGDDGLEITSARAVTINTSAGSTTANNNGDLGITIVNTGGTAGGTRTIGIGRAAASTTAIGNTNGNISITAGGNTTLTNVTATNSTAGNGATIASTVAGVTTTLSGGTYSGNFINGILVNTLGAITATNVNALTNRGNGLNATTNNAVTLTGVTMNGNSGNGAAIDNSTGTSNVTLTGVNTFSSNSGTGLNITTARQATINTSSGATTANANGNIGISIVNTGGTAGGTRTIGIGNATASTTAIGNTNGNISITAGGNTTLTNVTATNSTAGNGATIASTVSGATATITNGIYSGNQNNGININNRGNISITGTTQENNGNYGLDITSNAATVTLQRNQFINNGFNNATPTDINLSNSHATAFWTMSTNYFSGQAYSFRLAAGRLNANNNWWGSNSQPLNGSSGLSEGYFLAVPAANLTLTQWIILRVSATPLLINGATVSTITANMNYNNLGATGFGNLPNGLRINFSTTLGALSSSVGLLNSGLTTTTLGSAGVEGYATVSGTIGNQTTNAPLITIDLVGPATTIASGPTGYTNSTSATFTFNASDTYSTVSGFWCSLDGSAYGACTSPLTISGLAASPHSFSVYAFDAAGNNGTPASWNWTIDITAPIITPSITGSLGSNNWYTSDVNLAWIVTEPESTPTLTTIGCGSLVVVADTTGISLTCSATSAGGSSSSTLTIQRDATAPVITPSMTPISSPSGWWNISTGAPTLSFTCSDATAGLASPCPLPNTFGDGAAQAYSAAITDLAGNSASATVSNVNVDLTAPSITANITPPPSGTGWYNISTGVPTISYVCTDAISGVVACPPNFIFGEGYDQSHVETILDLAGNSRLLSTSGIHVDLSAPQTQILSTPPVVSSQTNATFDFTSTDTYGISQHECNLDHSGWNLCTSPITYNSMHDGSHEFQVRGIDLAGNIADPVLYSWLIFVPDIPVTSVYENPIRNVASGERVRLSCSGSDTLQLPTGHQVKFDQVLCNYEVVLNLEEPSALPNSLPENIGLLSGITLQLFKDDIPLEILPFGALATISIPLPAGSDAAHLQVQFWDHPLDKNLGGWMTLPPSGGKLHPDQPDDMRIVFQPISVAENPLSFSTNFTGTFVVIQ